MDRAKAKTMTTRVQLAAGAFVALALVAAVAPLGASKADTSTPAAPTPPPAAPKPAEAAAPKIEVDVPLLATALNSVSGPVKNQKVDQPATETVAPAPAPVTGLDAWRFLGAITSNSYKRAIVNFNDSQHLLSEGQRFNPDGPLYNPSAQPGAPENPAAEVEVVEITPTYIKVKQGETEKQIDIAPRQRAALNVLDPSAVRNAANGVQIGTNRPVSSGYNGANAAPSDMAAQSSKQRMRDLERKRDDAKARGDEKSALAFDQMIADGGKDGSGKEGKLEKSEKGAK